ncbi:MAG: hypothetical protein WBB01_04560 [Phormidesmis sp.]
MYLLVQEVAAGTVPYSLFLTIIGVVGFAAAVSIGSVAWYNSKRPVGWEAKERPDVVPKVDKNTDS